MRGDTKAMGAFSLAFCTDHDMQLEMEGTLDHLIDELKNTYNQPLPEADLLLSNSYDELMLDVVDVKDLPPGMLRMYGPLEPWLDKTWRPGEIELVK